EAERQLETVGRRVREVVRLEDVVVAPALRVRETARGRRHVAQRLLSREREEAVPAVRRGVLDERVPAALLEHEDARGVLTAVVHAVAVTPDAEVEGVLTDLVVVRAPQSEAPTREEREVVVRDGRAIDAVEQDPVLAAARA